MIYNVQLTGSNRFDSQMQMHTGNQKNDVSLAKEIQKNLKKENFAKIVSLIRANTKKIHGNKMDRNTVSCSG